jgi:hypothetical protein
MITIHKYPLEIIDIQPVIIPKAFSPLSVQIQNGKLCLWALVDNEAKKVTRNVYIVGTGNPAPEQANRSNYVGTVQSRPFVWHVFMGKT